MTDEETDLLTAVRLNPDCDTTRLVYADWLDEQGVEYVPCPACLGAGWEPGRIGYEHCNECLSAQPVPDTGRKDRAEFIRVQCEISRNPWSSLVCPHCGYDDGYNHNSGCLYSREYELIEKNPEWRPACPVCDGRQTVKATSDPHGRNRIRCGHCSGTGRVGEFRRGLLEVVQVPTLATVWKYVPPKWDAADTWCPTPWALTELVPHMATVREVWCGDQAPTRDGGDWEWYGLPDFLCVPDTKQTFRAPDAARRALAVAVADTLREYRT